MARYTVRVGNHSFKVNAPDNAEARKKGLQAYRRKFPGSFHTPQIHAMRD